ncbi:hypothetical protein BSZ36_00625 [Rubricoccus marinus]|uniref:Uncharacterized protein n=1 Tax=Rubricoccus marinus TaxID=716817 RepID=A0A259TV23_9BACT|nr:hypothetical protein BSZ36_00625 [Rubricoccus marinus]
MAKERFKSVIRLDAPPPGERFLIRASNFSLNDFGTWAEQFKPADEHGMTKFYELVVSREDLLSLLDATGMHCAIQRVPSLPDFERLYLRKGRGTGFQAALTAVAA